MSAEVSPAYKHIKLAILWGLFGYGTAAIAEDSQAPELEFLEYLGSWEDSDEDWVLFAADEEQQDGSQEQDEESEPTPDGEKLAELEDED